MLRQLDLFRKSDERFVAGDGQIRRTVLAESEWEYLCIDAIVGADPVAADLKGAWWTAYLAGRTPYDQNGNWRDAPVRVADLFCGIGGFSLGVDQFFAEAGRRVKTELAVDVDSKALDIFTLNHWPTVASSRSVASFVDNGDVPKVDLVIAGPPCQGYSGLNSTGTRFNDPRNDLYFKTAEFVIASNCRAFAIENVPFALHDYGDVIGKSRQLLAHAGYNTSLGVWHADRMGWPQTRSRLFLVGCRDAMPFAVDHVAEILRDNITRSALWAFDQPMSTLPVMNIPTRVGPENQARIDYLFDHDKYDRDDIPSHMLPASCNDPTLSFTNYCRMRPDEPSGTLACTFQGLKTGRTIHPTERRTMTVAEGAVLQGFPAAYDYIANPDDPPVRTNLAKWIGNAVPMPLGYAAGLAVSPAFI